MHALFEKADFIDIEILTPGQLDVDITLNTLKQRDDIKLSRFEKTLLSRGEDTLNAFQTFLTNNQLSSHYFVWAKKN